MGKKKTKKQKVTEETEVLECPAAEAVPATSKKAGKKKKKEKKQSETVTKKQTVFGSPVRNLIVTALVGIVVGLAFILKPTETYTYCGYGLGGLTALVGIVYIIIYFARRPVSGVYRSEFGIGLTALLAGAYVAVGGLVFSDNGVTFTFNLVVKILGILMALDGVLKLQNTLDLARMKYKRWWVCLITGVLGLGLGVVMVMGLAYDIGVSLGASLGNKYFYFTVYGGVFCLNGVLDIVAMAFIANRNHLANKAAAIASAEAMMAGVEPEEVQDFFPEAGTSAVEETVLTEEVPATVAEPEYFSEPEPFETGAEETTAEPTGDLSAE